jgi:hypothetical protein
MPINSLFLQTSNNQVVTRRILALIERIIATMTAQRKQIVALLSFLFLAEGFQNNLRHGRGKVACRSSRGLLEDTFKGPTKESLEECVTEDVHLAFPGGGR